MSSLTEEQRRRMEENRRKALEKRAAASARNAGGNVSAPPTGPVGAGVRNFQNNPPKATSSMSSVNPVNPSGANLSATKVFRAGDSASVNNKPANVDTSLNTSNAVCYVFEAFDAYNNFLYQRF